MTIRRLIKLRDYRLDTVGTKQYSAIEHIAGSVFLNHDPKARFMVMFTAYFDDSGTHEGSKVTVVAGYISTVEQWKKLESEWRDVLNDAGIEFFRMSKYESKHGPYEGWDEFKRKRVLERLILIARVRTRIPVAAAITVSDYHEVLGAAKRLSPYTFCALQCIAHVREWAGRYKHEEPIAYVFESGTTDATELHTMRLEIAREETLRNRYQLDSLTFQDKRANKALQAADMLAYEFYKEMVNCVIANKQTISTRWSALQLLAGKPIEYCGYYDKDSLLASGLSANR